LIALWQKDNPIANYYTNLAVHCLMCSWKLMNTAAEDCKAVTINYLKLAI